MVDTKSLDEVNLIAALLCDVHTLHGDVFNTRALRLTTDVVVRRTRMEGLGFLTKSLPRLGKALDKALSLSICLNATELGFSAKHGTKLPRFLGELFSQVLGTDGAPLPHPCINCIQTLRDVLYLFYKYELPYTIEQEHHVIAKFIKTEQDLEALSSSLKTVGQLATDSYSSRRGSKNSSAPFAKTQEEVVREARIVLSNLFSDFDPRDIRPRHGPGAVATKQRLWEKFQWTNVSSRITDMYPLDEYFYSSGGAVCDSYRDLSRITDRDLPARVILVPKDSRGPRLISCEPVDFQWIQQGLSRALVSHVESHVLTRHNVFFTDQTPNRIGALYGSRNGRYATLDLNEASDRVSLDLVRLLFPPHICEYLEACRTCSTELPNGQVIRLNKFAPMGSALCFPILALTVWSILHVTAPDADARESIHVYGDDVIVTTASAENAMKQLESFGLKINREKSCIQGFFRESCGMDAYKGVPVTPVRIRTVWKSSPSPDVYTSWCSYQNALYDKRYYWASSFTAELLGSLYGPIPSSDMQLACPCLRGVPSSASAFRVRTNIALQKREWLVPTVCTKPVKKNLPGWSMLLRYFTETASNIPTDTGFTTVTEVDDRLKGCPTSDVRSYTRRGTSMLVRRWR